MKKFLTITLMAVGLMLGSCQKEYDDSALWEEVNDHSARLAALETWQKQVNSNITALQGLVSALQDNRFISGVTAFTDPAPGGYTISFADTRQPNPLTIHNGNKGETGEKGTDGSKGETGEKGADGSTPQISVGLDDGVYYWKLNGEWLLDGSGNKIPVTGAKGDKGDPGAPGNPGDPGAPGTDGATPRVAIGSDGYWYVCPDGTCTEISGDDLSAIPEWVNTGTKATGDNGQDGDPGAPGAQGPRGDAIFAANGVDNSNPDYVVFTLADNSTTITILKYKELGIFFDQPAGFLPSEAREVGFTVTGGASVVKVTDVPRGWTVTVSEITGGAGTFTVEARTTPRNGEALVLVSDGKERTIISPKSLELKASYLNVDASQLNLSASSFSDDYTFDVESNTDWSVAVNGAPAWCTLVSPASGNGSGSAEVKINVSENPVMTARGATITVSSAGLPDVEVLVEQAAGDSKLSVSPAALPEASVTASADTYTLNVTSNTAWSVAVNGAATWCTLSSSGATGDDLVNVGVTENASTATRSATVTFTYDGKTKDVIVTQAAGAAVLTASPTTIPASSATANYTLNVTSNTDWSVAVDGAPDWCTLSASSGNEDGSVDVTVQANPAVAERSATITFTYNGETKTVVVTQDARKFYAKSTITLESEGKTWSDVIQIPECKTGDLATDGCRGFTNGGSEWVYYDWNYVNNNAAELCPSPWHVPTKEELDVLDLDVEVDTKDWGSGGFVIGSSDPTVMTSGYFWSTTGSGVNAYYGKFGDDGSRVVDFQNKTEGLQVRCIK